MKQMFGDTNTEKKTNPVGLFFTRKSDKENKTGKFVGWNKDLEQEVSLLPKDFILLSQVSTIKGWDNVSNSGIYSNEVVNTKQEEFVVRAFKSDKPLYQGEYNKEKINALGGDFHKGLIVQEGDLLVEYFLKGGALFQWNEDIANINTTEYKVELDKIEEKKKGSITYYVPRRKQGAKITDKEREVALMNVDLLKEYRA